MGFYIKFCLIRMFCLAVCAVNALLPLYAFAEESVDEFVQYMEQPPKNFEHNNVIFKQNIKEFLEPRLSFQDFEGVETTLKSRRGKFVVMYMFATWCMSCSDELKALDKMVKELEFIDVRDIEVMPVSIDFKEPSKVFDLYRNLGIKNLRVYFDYNKKAMIALGVKSMPTTLLVDHTGYIVSKLERNISWSKKDVISDLLDVASQSRDRAKSDDRKKTYDLREEGDIMFQKDNSRNVTIIN
jgi:thiol-disulfide isomerase/thioredoxin